MFVAEDLFDVLVDYGDGWVVYRFRKVVFVDDIRVRGELALVFQHIWQTSGSSLTLQRRHFLAEIDLVLRL